MILFGEDDIWKVEGVVLRCQQWFIVGELGLENEFYYFEEISKYFRFFVDNKRLYFRIKDYIYRLRCLLLDLKRRIKFIILRKFKKNFFKD